jgi:hypothetical protein
MLTVTDLKAEIKSIRWEILTENDDSVGEGCLDKARLWLRARLSGAGIVFDPTTETNDPIIRRIIIAYALYQLYSYAEQESSAADKKADALELIASYLSVAAAGNPASSEQSAAASRPAGAIAVPTRERRIP